MQIRYFLVVAALLLCDVCTARAETFEIWPSSGSCSEEFESVANALEPGDELILHGGEYGQSCNRSVNVNGTAEQPIVIRAADGEQPVLTNVTSQNNIELTASHLVLRGLHFRGASSGIRVKGGTHHVTIEDCEVSETSNNAIAVNNGNADSLIIRRNHIHHTGQSSGNTEGEGMYLGCNNDACRVTNSLIEGNYIHHLRGTSDGGNDGIEVKVGSYGNIIRNNVIHDTTIGKQFPCIFVYGGGQDVNVVEGNAMWNCGEGIQVGSDAVIRNNVILNSKTGILAIPHVQVGPLRNVEIVNNTIYGHTIEGLFLRWSSATDMIVANNAIYCPGETAVDAQGLSQMIVDSNYVEGSMIGASVDDSAFFSGGSSATQFADAENFDLWPTLQSVLRGSAGAVHAPGLDFNETLRTVPHDVGAYATKGLAENPGWRIVAGPKPSGEPDPTPPSVPQALDATAAGEDRIQLTWAASTDSQSGVSFYRIYRDSVEVAQSAGTSHEDVGLAAETTYVYAVSAINGVGLESALSASASATTNAAAGTPPAPPTGLATH